MKEIWSSNTKNINPKQNLYLCLLWILKNINREVLKKYISIEMISKVMDFIEMLTLAKEILDLNKTDPSSPHFRKVNDTYLDLKRIY